jgi:hypothetical protein
VWGIFWRGSEAACYIEDRGGGLLGLRRVEVGGREEEIGGGGGVRRRVGLWKRKQGDQGLPLTAALVDWLV